MSDLAHRFDRESRGCVCGSAWNWHAEACSFIIPLPVPVTVPRDDDDDEGWNSSFFECRKGHAFCARH